MLSRRQFSHQILAGLTLLAGQSAKASEMAETPRVPAEWEPHQYCVMAWCAQHDLYSPREIRAIHHEQAMLARAVAQFEKVIMLVNPEDEKDTARALGPAVSLLPLRLNDVWTRDTLPLIGMTNKSRIGLNLNFNGWGDEFLGQDGHDPYARDKALARLFLHRMAVREKVLPVIAEGGAIELDGQGTLITTETCLLNRNRNPGLGKRDIEAAFREHMGIERVIWLYGSDADQVTDGHVDGMTRFIAPGVVVTEVTDDRQDPEYHDLQENLARLNAARDAKGRKLTIYTMQRPYWDEMPERGDDFAASYANYYLPNGGLVMAGFGDRRRDQDARDLLQKLMPTRKIITLRADTIAEGGGGIHCNTWQMPA